jgi:hypothetical protein
MQYRKFKLLNSRGDEYTLTEKNFKVFANNPQGLGFSKSISTLRLGDEEVLLYSMVNLDTISFELLFWDDDLGEKYEKYREFMSFISFKPLMLYYQRPNSFDWFRRRIEIVSLGKTEVSFDDSMLHCPLNMKTLGFWEDDIEHILEIEKTETEEGKIYPITYPINYGSNSLSGIQVISQGLLDTPVEIYVNGYTENAEWIIYDSNDTIYGRTKFIGEFDSIYVNSRESEEDIKLFKNGLYLDNPLSYQDLTVGSPNEINITFLKLKAGQSKISFLLGLEFEGNVVIKWRNRYVSV